MSKKKIFLITIASFLILACSFGTTYAFLHAKKWNVNEFTVGENIIEVRENYEPPEKLAPKVQFKKEPYVVNTGNVPCFVRMRADFSDSKAENFCEKLVINPNWEKDESDGYYYYKHLLQPKSDTVSGRTEPLFTYVKIKEGTDANAIEDFDILIYAESCFCSEHNGKCDDKEYKTIWDKS